MKEKKVLYKIVSFINREELDFLDKIAKDIYFSTGKKIPRCLIIREIIQISKNVSNFGKDLIKELKQEGQAILKGAKHG